ncbi:MAG TPA: hypothetical protein VJ932_11515 [Alkalispirochaeta sp.]|nr:hypothetical protein [Alkalispirochaeta sp.]
MLVSVVGYAKSGKTTWVLAFIQAAVAAGLRVALIKTGRRHPPAHLPRHPPHRTHQRDSDLPGELPDSIRARNAGADPTAFWCDEGLSASSGNAQYDFPIPLPPRKTFGTVWWSLLPAALQLHLESADIIIVEGRIVAHATVVHLATTDTRKYAPKDSDVVVRSFDEIPRTAAALIGRARIMPGKHTAPRRGDNRPVTLQVNGRTVDINGYVMDVFQEVVVGLVRSLGTENPEETITISVGPANPDDGD